MKSSWRRRGRRALRPIPKLQMAQDLFDDLGSVDQAYDLQQPLATRTDQRVGFVNLLNQACPGAPHAARAFVLRIRGLTGLAGQGAGMSSAGAADVGELPVVPY